MEKDFSLLEFQVTADIPLNPSNPTAGQARPDPSSEFERLPEDPTVEASASLPLTRRSACLSSLPNSRDFVAFLEVKEAATALTQPQQGNVSVQHGGHSHVRTALGR